MLMAMLHSLQHIDWGTERRFFFTLRVGNDDIRVNEGRGGDDI